jgi:alpha(1,3/1,4) fucosyltransferase
MKYKATLVVGNPIYYNNRRFFLDTSDDFGSYDVALKNELAKYDIDLSTEDINKAEEADAVIYTFVPKYNISKNHQQKKYLLIIEPPVVLPTNWDKKNHTGYDRVFTWNESLVDNQRYFLLRLGFNLKFDPGDKNFKDRKLCTMIAGYKYFCNHPRELYTKRNDAVKWFTRFHPTEFEYYGKNWPDYLSSPRFNKIFRIIPSSIKRIFFLRNTTYRGVLATKHTSLQRYRFSICYENMCDVPGYVTEKIFDSFAAGCIPIYWGASNIKELIPADCFIDRRDFKTYEDLYDYIKKIDTRQYLDYLDNIKKYLNSEDANIFTATTYAQTLTNYILQDIKNKL